MAISTSQVGFALSQLAASGRVIGGETKTYANAPTRAVVKSIKRVDPKKPFSEYFCVYRKDRTQVRMPQRGTAGSVGYDVWALHSGSIAPGDRALVDTGLKAKPPTGTYIRVAPRSGLSVKGIDIGAGTVDPDYSGFIKILIINNSKSTFSYSAGINSGADAVAQFILTPYVLGAGDGAREVDNIEAVMGITERGDKGFGSTNVLAL